MKEITSSGYSKTNSRHLLQNHLVPNCAFLLSIKRDEQVFFSFSKIKNKAGQKSLFPVVFFYAMNVPILISSIATVLNTNSMPNSRRILIAPF